MKAFLYRIWEEKHNKSKFKDRFKANTLIMFERTKPFVELNIIDHKLKAVYQYTVAPTAKIEDLLSIIGNLALREYNTSEVSYMFTLSVVEIAKTLCCLEDIGI